MRLATYMALMELTDTAMAERLGCSQSYVIKLRHGEKQPSLNFARVIREVTGGAVGFDDLFNDPEPPRHDFKRLQVT